MPLSTIFDIAGSAMSAQSVRLNTVASNLANADSVATTPDQSLSRQEPGVLRDDAGNGPQRRVGGVKVEGVTESQAPVTKQFEPGNPLADATGYVYMTNVNPVKRWPI